MRVQLGRPGPHTGRGGVTAGHLVAEQLLEELDVAEVVATRQRQALGQRGDKLAELEATHEDLELGRDRRRGRAHCPASVALVNSEGSRAKRPWITTGLGRHVGIGIFSGPFEHARDEVHVDRLGLEGPRQASSTRSGPHFLTRPRRR